MLIRFQFIINWRNFVSNITLRLVLNVRTKLNKNVKLWKAIREELYSERCRNGMYLELIAIRL